MKNLTTLLLMAAIVAPLMACSTVKKFTGQRDDTVLPGNREEILPPEAQTARDPVVTGQEKKAKCAPDDLNCIPPSGDNASPDIDQESSTAQ
jgi:hypothetical protein